MKSKTTQNVLWFAAGLSFGAAVGVLLAPKPGAETRKYLYGKSDVAREYLHRGKELYDRGRELADEAAAMYEEGRHLVEGQI